MAKGENLVYDLDLLLDYAKDESTVGQIGGMLCHSNRYEELYSKVSSALDKYNKHEEAINVVRSIMNTWEDDGPYGKYTMNEILTAFSKWLSERIPEEELKTAIEVLCQEPEEENNDGE